MDVSLSAQGYLSSAKMPLGLRFGKRRKPAVEHVATAAFRVASQTAYAATGELPAATHGPAAATTELKTTASDSRTVLEPVLPRDLWDEAYEALRRTNSKTVEQYEEIVTRVNQEDTHLAPVGSLARQEQLANLITRRLESMEKDQKSFMVAGKKVVLQEHLNKVIRIVMLTKDFVSSAVSAEPHAALAWAGVCVLLPVSVEYFFHFFSTFRGFPLSRRASVLCLRPTVAALEQGSAGPNPMTN